MQYILLQTYMGPSDFTYAVAMVGRKLTIDEAIELGLTNRNELDRNKRSAYIAEWYEIKPGDEITIEYQDDETKKSWAFTVLETGLPEPPVSLDDERAGPRLHEYLKKHCQYVE